MLGLPMRPGLALLVLSSGCLALPDRPGPLDGCRNDGEIASAFDGGRTCASWGTAWGGVSPANVDGRLRFTSTEVEFRQGGCRVGDPLALPDTGFFVEVTHVPEGGSVSMSAGDGSLAIGASNGVLEVYEQFTGEVFGSVPYDPAAMRWWRIRPEPDSTRYVGEYSAEARHWTALGAWDMDAPATYQVELSVGLAGGDGRYGELDNFNVCPD